MQNKIKTRAAEISLAALVRFVDIIFLTRQEGGRCVEYLVFVRERITELRLAKGIKSERELSRRLGKNELYIQHITSGKQNVGLTSFFDICAFFDITPQEFFDPDLHNPGLVKETMKEIEKLPDDDIRQLKELARKLNKK